MGVSIENFSKIKKTFNSVLNKISKYPEKEKHDKALSDIKDFMLETFIDDICTGEEFLLYKTNFCRDTIDSVVELWKSCLLPQKKDTN